MKLNSVTSEITRQAVRPSLTIAIIAVVVVALAAADRFLARVESAEINGSAQRSYALGARLLAQGQADAAIDALREAQALDRQNSEYSLQLVSALSADGKTAEAEPLLNDVLQRRPNDGRANLLAARLMVRRGDAAEAEAYFHRAIYGEWPVDGQAQRAATRTELVDLLVRKRQKQELLAELISLEAESPADRDKQLHLAELFLSVDAPSRAAAVYQALVEKDPKDIQAFEGLGDAELQLGQYRAAHDAYLRVFLKEPNNASARAHLQTLNTVTEMDPTLRQLTSAEKYRRSVRILSMARETLAQCASKSAGSDENQQLLQAADARANGSAPNHVTNEAAEEVLILAEKLWHSEASCEAEKSGDPNALTLIMKKLAS